MDIPGAVTWLAVGATKTTTNKIKWMDDKNELMKEGMDRWRELDEDR